jgi:uncharacterized RDD family membrane protein YckC
MNVSVSSLRRPPPAYVPADESYRAVATPLWRRAAAAAVDWLIVVVGFLVLSIPFGIVQALGQAIGGPFGDLLYVLAQVLALAVVPAYFAYFYGTGHTMGMRVFDVHVFAYRTGREPDPGRSTARALLALLFFVATSNAYAYLDSVSDLELSTLDTVRRSFAFGIAAIAILGALWKLVDAEGRTLWDKLCGLVVVEDVVPTSMPDRLWSPWGT